MCSFEPCKLGTRKHSFFLALPQSVRGPFSQDSEDHGQGYANGRPCDWFERLWRCTYSGMMSRPPCCKRASVNGISRNGASLSQALIHFLFRIVYFQCARPRNRFTTSYEIAGQGHAFMRIFFPHLHPWSVIRTDRTCLHDELYALLFSTFRSAYGYHMRQAKVISDHLAGRLLLSFLLVIPDEARKHITRKLSTNVRVCVCVCIYIYIHTHVHTHTYIYPTYVHHNVPTTSSCPCFVVTPSGCW
jgi:hypothetical protein